MVWPYIKVCRNSKERNGLNRKVVLKAFSHRPIQSCGAKTLQAICIMEDYLQHSCNNLSEHLETFNNTICRLKNSYLHKYVKHHHFVDIILKPYLDSKMK